MCIRDSRSAPQGLTPQAHGTHALPQPAPLGPVGDAGAVCWLSLGVLRRYSLQRRHRVERAAHESGIFLIRRQLLTLLKARPAQDRTALGRLERHGGLCCALRAGETRLRANSRGSARALRLALLAVLGIICELFVVEEQLLAGCKNEVGAAIYTFQYAI